MLFLQFPKFRNFSLNLAIIPLPQTPTPAWSNSKTKRPNWLPSSRKWSATWKRTKKVRELSNLRFFWLYLLVSFYLRISRLYWSHQGDYRSFHRLRLVISQIRVLSTAQYDYVIDTAHSDPISPVHLFRFRWPQLWLNRWPRQLSCLFNIASSRLCNLFTSYSTHFYSSKDSRIGENQSRKRPSRCD